jgi:membrane dipeptidase
MTTISSFRKQIKEDPKLLLAQSTDDVHLAHQKNKLAVGFDIEGAVPLCERPEMVELYWQLGVRQIHLSYNRNNSIAGGCHDDDPGLSSLGKEVVQSIFDCGMLMDLSHMGRISVMDVCNMASKPVVFSHANPYSMVPHPRNIPDELIKACAETGGVICINGVERFLGLNQLTVERFSEHVAYVAELVGTAHVGIGIDTFTTEHGIIDMPEDLDDNHWWPKQHYKTGIGQLRYLQPENIPDIKKALHKIGFLAEETNDILGGNMMRVAKQCWPSSSD